MSIDDPEDTSPRIPGTRLTGEDIQVVSLRLQDAVDDLNDLLRETESLLSEKGFGSARVPIPPFEDPHPAFRRTKRYVSDHTLFWSGRHFVYEDGKNQTPLLNASRAARIRAAGALPALARELGIP